MNNKFLRVWLKSTNGIMLPAIDLYLDREEWQWADKVDVEFKCELILKEE